MSISPAFQDDEARLAVAFDRALSHDLVRPALQPIVHLESGAISSFEVLARWTDDELGVVPPATFIPMAERHSLIAPLTAHLIRVACSAARSWSGRFRLTFNISPLHFQDGNMPSLLEDAVNETRFPLERVQIEITETAIIDDLVAARATIDLLRSKGVRILLDDFGTGYSSLTRLQALSFDKIKIDGSFVRSMEASRDSRKIVSAVIGLAQSLGAPVVAEGVESEAQLSILKRLGCDLGQGWLLGRAVPPEEAPALLRSMGEIREEPLPRNLSTNQRLAQLEAVYAAAPVGLCFVDWDLRILNANQRFAEMMGRAAEDIIGHGILDIYPVAYDHLLADLRRAEVGETVPQRRLPLPLEGRIGLLTTAAARDEDGELIGLSLAIVDL
jgi:PAS domain S-box-containing protein